MNGGLLQLVTIGKEDSALIKDPEIVHYKKVFVPYAKFAIDTNYYNIGRKNFNSEFEMIVKKEGDLLKDVSFYVDIPYFEIEKSLEEKITTFNRTESDKIYYNSEGSKTLVYYIGNNMFYLIPESVFYLENETTLTEINSQKIILINSPEYSTYFDNKSKFEKISFQENNNHPSINYLKTIESYWFNTFINKIKKDNANDIVLMDFEKFTNWLNNKMETRLFFDYHILFNKQKYNKLYQINFETDRRINELKKYFKILEKIKNLKSYEYNDEGLDIDNAILELFSKKNIIEESDIMYIENSFMYSSRNILLSLNKLYDDSYDNYHTMFKMFKVANNEIISSSYKVYDIYTWTNFKNKYFDISYNNNTLEFFSSNFVDKYKLTLTIIKKKLELLWNNLDFKIENNFNVDYIFSIIYTFIVRYNNFNNYDTINFLDFFEKNGEKTFSDEFKDIFDKFNNTIRTDLNEINSIYGNNFDLTIIYNFVFYSLADNIQKLNIFDNIYIDGTFKQNIQFIYWWRNKFANMIFLRYMRLRNNKTRDGNNFYPSFDSFRDPQELINFFYTFIPNFSVSIDEAYNDLFGILHKRSYIGHSSERNINAHIINKTNVINTNTFNEDNVSIIKGKFIINISYTQYIFTNGIITFSDNCNIINNYFNNDYKLIIKYNDIIYDTTFTYINNRININITGISEMIDDFEIIVFYKTFINKYYFEHISFQINGSEITIESTIDGIITFGTTRFIDTNKFNFKLNSIESINILPLDFDGTIFRYTITTDHFTIEPSDNITGYFKFENKYLLYNTNVNNINKDNTINFIFDLTNTYYLEIEDLSGIFQKYIISFVNNTNINSVYFKNIIDSTYKIEKLFDFKNIKSIYINLNISYIDSFNVSCTINEIESRQNITIDIDNNKEFYNSYIVNYQGIYYFIYNDKKIYLSSPTIESNNIIFYICNSNDYQFTNISSILLYSINSSYLPNLINYTSFYPLPKSDRTYDLMDYFIQTPMLIYIDNQTSNFILNNININFDIFNSIEYLLIDDNNLFISNEIQSNQLVRYNNILISTVFDQNIFYSNENDNIIRENLANTINDKLQTILSNNNIGKIITAIENTDKIIRSADEEGSLHQIYNSEFGKTSKRLFEIFQNSNIYDYLGIEEDFFDEMFNKYSENNYNILNKLNCNDYNFFSKFVLDLNGLDNNKSFDENLGYNTSIGDGKDIFFTNYMILQNRPKLNEDMLDYLDDYWKELNAQKIYIDNNKLWISLYSKSTKSNFDYFTSFQQEYKNMLYQDDIKEYTYMIGNTKFIKDNSTFEDSYYINENKVTINHTDMTIKSNYEIKPINETIIFDIINSTNTTYSTEKNKFNCFGSVIISMGQLILKSVSLFDSLPLVEDTNIYILVDNIKCILVNRKLDYFNIENNYFETDDKINRYLTNIIIYQASLNTIDFNFIEEFVYIYIFEKNDDVSINDFLLIDNVLTIVINNNYLEKYIQILSYKSLVLDNLKYMKGSVNENSLESYFNILNYNLTNVINFLDIEYIFGTLVDIKHYNVYSDNSNIENSTYCTLEDGILDIISFDSKYYTFITSSTIYILESIFIQNKPLILFNGTIKYNNINSTILDSTILFDETNMFKLKNINTYYPTDTIIDNLWIFNGNIEDNMEEYDVYIDFDNKTINIDTEQYDNLKNIFFYIPTFDVFYKFSDFSNESSTTNLEKVYIINNCFSNMESYYTYNMKTVDNVMYHKISNTYDENSDLKNMVIYSSDSNYFRYKTDNTPISSRELILFFKTKSPNSILFTRPINITLLDSNEIYNRLYYTTYKENLNSSSEIDSIFKINISNPTSGNTLESVPEINRTFYIKFNENHTPNILYEYSEDYFKEYKYNKMFTSKIDITCNDSFITTLFISNNTIKIIIDSNFKYIDNNFYKIIFGITFNIEDTTYTFPIIYYLLVDDNIYTQQLEYKYNSKYIFLREPLVIFNDNDNIIRDKLSNFYNSIPDIFDVSGGNAIVDNGKNVNVTIVDTNYKFMDYNDKEYSDMKKIVKISETIKSDYNWEMLDFVTIQNNMILNFEKFNPILDRINFIIIEKDEKLYYLELLEKYILNYNFESTFKCLVFTNLNILKTIYKKIFINVNIEVLYTEFGLLYYGDVIKIGNTIIFIKNFSEQMNGYVYDILNPTNQTLFCSYESFIYLGSLNNFSKKENLVNYKINNNFILCKPDLFLHGDFIYNNSYIGLYDDSMKLYISDNDNYGIIETDENVILYYFNNNWYYFGKKITSKSIVVANYDNKSKIFKINSIINHKIEWDEPFDVLKLADKYNDGYIFRVPNLPFIITKKTELPKYGVILIENKFYMIYNYNIRNFFNTLNNTYYYTIKFNDIEYVFSDNTHYIENTNKLFYNNIELYYSNKSIIKTDRINFSLVDKEINSSKEFYYFDKSKYYYPVYLIKTSNLQLESITYHSIKYFYYDTITISTINTSDYENIDDIIYNDVFIKENNIATYPLYISNNFMLNDMLNNYNDMINLKLDVTIHDRTNIINIISLPVLFAVINTNYSYLITDNVIVKAKKIPIWLTLNITELNEYILSGIPTTNDLNDTMVELIIEDGYVSIIHKFNINIINSIDNFHITNFPITTCSTSKYYEYTIMTSNDISSIEILNLPSWLDIDISENKIFGYPNNDSVGLNCVALNVIDINDNNIILNYYIFVNLINPNYIDSKPNTTYYSDRLYEYIFSVNGYDNSTIQFELPNWLSVNLSENRIYRNDQPISTDDNTISIIFNNIYHTFKIFEITDIIITSQPILYAFPDIEYRYTITTNKLNYTCEILNAPDWLILSEDNILYGTPLIYYEYSIVEIKVIDNDTQDVGYQTFYINVFEFNGKIIKIMNGLEDIEHNIKLFHTLILNKQEVVCKNFVNCGNYYDLILYDMHNFIDTCELIIPTIISNKKTNYINNKPIILDNTYLSYKMNFLNNESFKLYCYYIANNQRQLTIFDCNIINSSSFILNNNTIISLINIDTVFYIENYIKIKIINYNNNIATYEILPFEIKNNSTIIIEEKNNDTINIFQCNIILENGLLKIDIDINNVNSDSDFYINSIIPIRIRGRIIQLIKPIITQTYSIGTSNKQELDQWLKIEVNKVSRPIFQNNRWKLEIISTHINLLVKNNLYTHITYDDNNMIEYVKEEGRYYLLYKNIPNTLDNFIFLKEKIYFNSIIKNTTTLKSEYELESNLPTDMTLLNYINEDWKLYYSFTQIPIIIEKTDITNTFIITNFNSINLDLINIEYYLDNPSNRIINTGINQDNKLEVLVSSNIRIKRNTKNTFIYYKTINSKITINNISEPTTTVSSKIKNLEKKNKNSKILFNVGKSIIDWTSISFYDNIRYENVFQSYIVIDANENYIFKDDIDNFVLLYEEIHDTTFINIVKLLAKDNFKGYYDLLNLRNIEYIVFNYINNNVKTRYFWIDPINNINTYISSYNYTIYNNCILHVDEIVNDSTKFTKLEDGSIVRNAYLDSQFLLSIDNNKMYVARNKNMINIAINSNRNSLFGCDSHKLLKYLSNTYIDKKRFMDDINNGTTFNYNYDIISIEKILLNKQWMYLKNINSKYMNMFNIDFHETLNINYNMKTECNGALVDMNNNIIPFGIGSFNNILFYDNSYEHYMVYSYTIDNTMNMIPLLESNDLYKYKIESSENVLINSNYKIQLDMLEGPNLLTKEIINITKYDSNYIEFKSNIFYDDINKISLNIIKDYTINSIEFIGYKYENVIIVDLNTTIFNLYYDDIPINISESIQITDQEYIINNTEFIGYKSTIIINLLNTSDFNLYYNTEQLTITETFLQSNGFLVTFLSNNMIELSGIKIEKLFTIESQEIISNKLYIYFTQLFNIDSILNDMYIIIDSFIYEIIKDNDMYYIDYNNLLNLEQQYIVFGYINSLYIDMIDINLFNYKITLDVGLDQETISYLNNYITSYVDNTKLHSINAIFPETVNNIGFIFNQFYVNTIDELTSSNILKLILTGVRLSFSSKIKINSQNFIKIEKMIGIKSQEIINNKIKINFTQVFYTSNINNVLNEMYIIVNDIPQLIIKEDDTYYIDSDNLLDLSINYMLFGYINIDGIEFNLVFVGVEFEEPKEIRSYIITINEELDTVEYKTKSPLFINYTMDNITLRKVEFINSKQLIVETDYILTNENKITSTFCLEKDDPLIIINVENVDNPHIIKIINTTKLLSNCTITLISPNDDINISGTIYENVINEYFLFNTSNKINLFEIVNYYTKIENIINVIDYMIDSNNILYFQVNEEFIFYNYDYIKYYIDINGTYQHIDTQYIIFINGIIQIDLSSYTYTNSGDMFNFKQEEISVKKYLFSEFNLIANVTLGYKRKVNIGDNFYLNIMSITNEELANYFYKITTDGIDNYIITNNKLDLNMYPNSTISYIANFTEGIVKNIVDDTHITVLLNTKDNDNNYDIFFKDNARITIQLNMYIHFYNPNSIIDLKANSSIMYSFPNELKYDRFNQIEIKKVNVKENVEWIENANYNIFEYIDFYLNDIKIDTMNSNIFNISDLYLKNKTFSMKPYLYENYFRIIIPTNFWFSKSSALYLPLIALENTEIKIKFKLNHLNLFIKNNMSNIITNIPTNTKISVITDTILLDKDERKNYAEYNHEYMIERNISYNGYILKNKNEIIELPFKSLVKDIFLITSSIKTKKKYFTKETLVMDKLYSYFKDITEKYNIYVNNNYSFNNISENYNDKVNMYRKIIIFLENPINKSLINFIKSHSILGNYDIMFIIFIYLTQVSYADNINFNTTTNIDKYRIEYKLTKIILYFKYIYKNEYILTKIDPIKNITFKSNGQELLRNQLSSYFNYVTTTKLEKTPDIGIYYYSFSLFPTSTQPSGHLNFNILKDTIVELELNDLINNENMFLDIIIKEYTILRIIGGIASLSWT